MAQTTTATNFGVSHITFNYSQDVFHQLDGRYIEHKGYTAYETMSLSVQNNIVANLQWTEQQAQEQGVTQLDNYPAYVCSLEEPAFSKETVFYITIDNHEYELTYTPVDVESFDPSTDLIYTADNKIAFMVTKNPASDPGNYINIITSYNLDNVSTATLTFNLEEQISSIVPLDYKFMPYVVNGGSSSKCGEAFNNNSNIASGQYSHAEGTETQAIGANSHTGGDHTIASYDNQTVIGKYNDNQENTLFEVGNGEAGSPSNAFMVYKDGRTAIAADPIEDLDVTTKQYVDKKTDKIPNKLEYITHVNTIEQLPQPFDDEEEYEDMTTPIRNLPILNYINKIKNPPITMTFSSKYKLNQLRKMAGSIAANKGLQYKNLFAYCMKQGGTTWDSRFFIWTDNTMASSNTYVALSQVIFNNPPEVENEPILIPIFHFKPTASKPMYIYCDNFYDGKGFVIYPKNSEKIIWNASTTNEYITMNTEFIIYPLINSEDENISDAIYSFLAQKDTSTYQTTTLLTNTSGNDLRFIGYEKLEKTFPDVFSEYSNVTKYNSYWDNSINIGRDGSYSSTALFSFDSLGNPDFGFKSGLIDADSIVTVGENNDIYYLSRTYQYQQWAQGSGTGGGTWGSITGTITDQTDLIDLVNNSGFIVNEVTDSSYDLNNSKTTGFYYISSSNITTLTHMPGNCTDGWLMVLKSANQIDVKQVFYRKGTINTNDWEMYSRTYFADSTTWSDWTQYLTNKDPLLQVNPTDTSNLNIWIETF